MAVYGVGICDKGKYTSNIKTGVQSLEYTVWTSLLKRCCSEKAKLKQKCYQESVVCDDWLKFQTFAEWCNNQTGFREKDDKGYWFALDKDILIKNNKLYSPESCVFIPQALNNLMCNSNTRRGLLPVGVVSFRGKFRSQIKTDTTPRHIGVFDTVEEAFLSYKTEREAYIKRQAEKYRHCIDPRAYEALVNYQVEITD